MSAPSPPPDPTLQVEQLRAAEAKQAKIDQDTKDAAEKARIAGLRTAAQGGAQTTARDYFTQQGLDPAEYGSSIDSIISGILGGINPEDPNPGGYFSDIGSKAFTQLQDAARSKAGRDVNSRFAPNYETTRLPFTLDDPALGNIEQGQRASADAIINNLLSRKVITDAGASAARSNLDQQQFGVRQKLQDIGTGVITGGQQDLINQANKARQTAATLGLGTAFDPSTFTSEADRIYQEFVNGLTGKIQAQVPKSLFDTTSIGAVAGAGQGAQNLAFDPAATAGIFGDGSEDENKNKTKTGTTIF